MRTPTEEQPCNGGTQRLYRFDNGYGASVVQHDFSYGSRGGRWELAVLHAEPDAADLDDYSLCYKTPITDDVIGWLNDTDVDEILEQIEALPPNRLCPHRTPPRR